MAACPNCQSYVFDGQLFCRTCGFCMESDFQISTRALGLPATPRAPMPAGVTLSGELPRCAGHQFALPLKIIREDEPFFTSITTTTRSELRLKSRRPQGFLGVGDLAPYTTNLRNIGEDQGVYVGRVLEGSAAENAGIQYGDVILSIN